MIEPLPQAILVDLDDTIIALTDSIGPCWEGLCAQFAPRCEGLTAEELLAAIDASNAWFWSDPERHRQGRLYLEDSLTEIVARALAGLDVDDPALAREMAEAFTPELRSRLCPFSGAVEALQYLREQGVRLALISNGSAAGQRAKVDRFDLEPLFDCIVIEGEFGLGKPDARVFCHALECLGIPPEQVWMVGDDLEADIAAAQRLGIYAIWHDYAGRGLPTDSSVRPDRIIRSLDELA